MSDYDQRCQINLPVMEVDWFWIVRIKGRSSVQPGRKKETQQNATQELRELSV